MSLHMFYFSRLKLFGAMTFSDVNTYTVAHTMEYLIWFGF